MCFDKAKIAYHFIENKGEIGTLLGQYDIDQIVANYSISVCI